ncbi:peptide-methionine (R)-S-oxide reductase MsrB [Neptunomonas phycophila]|uniref:peptide-methionine (R)-S-oxide reductase MsrB n=1 Tax=Neptunomonas TaxID=75687 RepID=UPI0015BE4B63|nr:peptide-methionine (R)-S-oxide reductase MsrB [Neptunomonas phycophila]QLE99212.1 peptide-methionine (R)-S-oxide reductase MsrB [Neptunomonas phycophila]
MNRRRFLTQTSYLIAAGTLATVAPYSLANDKQTFEIMRSEKEWRALLTDAEYAVMREEATERPNSSPLLHEKRAGVFHCKGCDLALYDASTKYESGTGWPSFYQELPNAVATKEDRKLFSVRTEAHCRRCGSHLGHIFEDGPAPTGLRHCLNGISLTFQPA